MFKLRILEDFHRRLGSAKSGNWGHAGRPGKRGGSVSKSVAMSLKTGKDWKERQAAAKSRTAVMTPTLTKEEKKQNKEDVKSWIRSGAAERDWAFDDETLNKRQTAFLQQGLEESMVPLSVVSSLSYYGEAGGYRKKGDNLISADGLLVGAVYMDHSKVIAVSPAALKHLYDRDEILVHELGHATHYRYMSKVSPQELQRSNTLLGSIRNDLIASKGTLHDLGLRKYSLTTERELWADMYKLRYRSPTKYESTRKHFFDTYNLDFEAEMRIGEAAE